MINTYSNVVVSYNFIWSCLLSHKLITEKIRFQRNCFYDLKDKISEKLLLKQSLSAFNDAFRACFGLNYQLSLVFGVSLKV